MSTIPPTDLVLLTLLCAVLSALAQAPTATTLAIRDVTVLPMAVAGDLVPHQTVVIASGRIIRVGGVAEVLVPAGATVIDGRGKFLLPGLADMHVHLSTPAELPMFVGHGVLTVRDLNGSPQTLGWRAATASGAILGPRLFVSGPMLADSVPWKNKVTPRTAQEAATAVRAQQAEGYDQIKIYDGITSEVFRTAIQTARELAMPSSGHIPPSVGFGAVLESGMTGFEHLDKIVFQAVGHGLDAAKIPEIARNIRASGMWVTPTLESMVQLWKIGSGGYDSLMARPEALASPAETRDFWTSVTVRLKGNRTLPPGTRYGPWTDYQFKLAGALAREGVPLMAGTDFPNAVLAAGYSLLRELDVMVEAGIPPAQVLLAATSAPARFFRQAEDWGTVTEGKRANLMLVDGNPLATLTALQNPAGVVLNGRWLDRGALAAMRGRGPSAAR